LAEHGRGDAEEAGHGVELFLPDDLDVVTIVACRRCKFDIAQEEDRRHYSKNVMFKIEKNALRNLSVLLVFTVRRP
jgi:hypothetical protein